MGQVNTSDKEIDYLAFDPANGDVYAPTLGNSTVIVIS
jgi:hypothetical protein